MVEHWSQEGWSISEEEVQIPSGGSYTLIRTTPPEDHFQTFKAVEVDGSEHPFITTPGIRALAIENLDNAQQLSDCVTRFSHGDWGDVDVEDRIHNDNSLAGYQKMLEHGPADPVENPLFPGMMMAESYLLLGVYEVAGKRIYVHWSTGSKPYPTVLLPEEY